LTEPIFKVSFHSFASQVTLKPGSTHNQGVLLPVIAYEIS